MTFEQPPARVRIAALPGLVGQRVKVCGFVDAIRDQKRMQFVVLRDRDGAVQLVHAKGDDALTRALSKLTLESALSVVGQLVSAPAAKLGGIEIVLEEARICGRAETPLPIAIDSSLEMKLDHRQVSLRFPQQQLVFAVQTTLEHAMREFWMAEGFREIHSPKLMGTFSESGAEAFPVKYFETTAYLAQSPQFYKQMAIAGGMEKVFEIGPAFRAERSFTSRHETEFISIDMEVAWIDSHHDLMALEERWLAHALAVVADRHDAEIFHCFGIDIVPPRFPFPKLSVEAAHDMLRAAGHTPEKTDDMDSESERHIADVMKAETGHDFLFITDYPISARPFYHMRHADRPRLTCSFDLFWSGLEVTTGAQREHRYDRLVSQAEEAGHAIEPLQGYLDFFRYGCPPHGGMGVGLARLLMRLLGARSVREVALLSRTPTRLSP
jgi:nondiscriminating aspartyl-tRNA synthetase